ncbi:TetR/AcrR family transcriptional regulator [Streptomyces sp. 8L]|uniref:TetR/AcrR family transcriptional regulator n=1 Tax=Streptomyces sp. 8L TaxID=2877242 RepID=UPI001CD633FC|nr:TetR family transcriptional regulator [Streptomyces sp. 8L]MCA1223775.1 TetR family transcriptional regulator [Streptomyces sp. 8L]
MSGSDASAPASTPGRRGRGRPARAAAGAGPGARERILAAARGEFAEHGYDRTSVRGIAAAAGVDPALVHHYFGTKEQLFGAAIAVSFEPATGVPGVLDGDRDAIGERLARYFLGVWEDEDTRVPLLAVMRSALTNETAADVLRSFVLRRLLEPIARALDVPDPRLGAELAASQMVGIAMLRYVVGVQPLAGVDAEEIVRRVAPTLQRHLTEQ